MVATDMYGKSPYGSTYTKLRKRATILPLLFRFLIITFYSFCYFFTLYRRSATFWDFILRLICLDLCAIFFFVSVIILFGFRWWSYGTAGASGARLLEKVINGFHSLPFVIWGFCLGCCSSRRFTSSFIFFHCK